jgi:uncharacterized protein
MKSRSKIVIGLLAVAMIALAGSAWGQDIKARMQARLPAIVALKAAGVVGEDNQGYLATMKPAGDKKNIIDAENQDRRVIYQAIAKKENTTADLVGRRRALQIAAKAERGTWIQDAKGHWVKK